jgi:hypothetical protein
VCSGGGKRPEKKRKKWKCKLEMLVLDTVKEGREHTEASYSTRNKWMQSKNIK